MRVRRRLRASVCWLGGGLLAGCAEQPGPPPVPVETPVVAAPVRLGPSTPQQTAPERELCDVLAGLLAGEPDGFVQLRGQTIAAERWAAEEIFPGLGSCVIEGSAWPRARFICASGRQGAERAHARFERLSAKIDGCLARPSWFPRNWEKGRRFEFAMGERQQAWMDRTTVPPTAVVLRVQQDLVHSDYQLFLNLQAVR